MTRTRKMLVGIVAVLSLLGATEAVEGGSAGAPSADRICC
jgi:hypothetical protein